MLLSHGHNLFFRQESNTYHSAVRKRLVESGQASEFDEDHYQVFKVLVKYRGRSQENANNPLQRLFCSPICESAVYAIFLMFVLFLMLISCCNLQNSVQRASSLFSDSSSAADSWICADVENAIWQTRPSSVWLMKGMFARKRYEHQQQLHESAALEEWSRGRGVVFWI